MSAIQWATVRDAIQAWFVAGSGLAGDHVIWAGQVDTNGNPLPRPAGTFIELRLTVLDMPIQADQRRYTLDTLTNTATDNIEGPRVGVLTATCFQGKTGGGAPSSTWALAILNEALTAAARDDIYDGLVTAGVAYATATGITEIGGQLGSTRLEPRATVTIRLNLASSITYTYPTGQGWIEHVIAGGNTNTDVQSVQVDVHR